MDRMQQIVPRAERILSTPLVSSIEIYNYPEITLFTSANTLPARWARLDWKESRCRMSAVKISLVPLETSLLYEVRMFNISINSRDIIQPHPSSRLVCRQRLP